MWLPSSADYDDDDDDYIHASSHFEILMVGSLFRRQSSVSGMEGGGEFPPSPLQKAISSSSFFLVVFYNRLSYINEGI
jgi:hypothetical protein